MSESRLRCVVVGCGHFAANHLHAWSEIPGVEVAAVCDVEIASARAAASRFAVPAVYDDAERAIREVRPDFVDIVTTPASHRALVELAASRGVHAICQKPLAPEIEDARAMVEAARRAGVVLMVHENFRWQTPLREVKKAAARIGPVFFGRISFRSVFDVFAAQPYLAADPRFIIQDLGVHLLDLARFYLGECRRLFALTRRVSPRIRGEDVASILLEHEGGAASFVDMSYASRLERELFPQTLVVLEGERGSAALGPDYALTVAEDDRIERRTAAPNAPRWADPGREAIQESVRTIQEHWVACLAAGREPETSGRDNLRTLELAAGAYESAARGEVWVGGAGGSDSSR